MKDFMSDRLAKEVLDVTGWDDVERDEMSGVPLYTINYLLERLPTGITIPLYEAEKIWLMVGKVANGFQALYEFNDDGKATKYSYVSKKLEDALGYLTLALKKDGVI
jgi:hypothetical protein